VAEATQLKGIEKDPVRLTRQLALKGLLPDLEALIHSRIL